MRLVATNDMEFFTGAMVAGRLPLPKEGGIDEVFLEGPVTSMDEQRNRFHEEVG